jgi:SAM-dependent methyltransferase
MSSERSTLSRALYIEGGALDASCRQETNAKLGSLDLGAEIAAALALGPGDALLDVACGTGEQLARWSQIVGPRGRAVGADFSPEAIAIASTRVAEALVADAAAIPLDDSSFDALCCNYAIYYFDDVPRALREWRRLLRPGGRLVVTGPAEGNNRELYDFHREASGRQPSDADLLANGFLADQGFHHLVDAGFTQALLTEFENRIFFPDPESFLKYWTATSLFLLTVPPAERAEKVARARALLDRGTAMVVRKRISLVSAVAAPGAGA